MTEAEEGKEIFAFVNTDLSGWIIEEMIEIFCKESGMCRGIFSPSEKAKATLFACTASEKPLGMRYVFFFHPKNQRVGFPVDVGHPLRLDDEEVANLIIKDRIDDLLRDEAKQPVESEQSK